MPEDQRLFYLLQRAAHQLRVAADRRCLSAAGITSAQLGALFVVRDRPGVTQQELAHELGQRESAITAMIGRLVEAGLVAKETHPTQHRAVVLTLTEPGTDALRRVRPEIEHFNAELRAIVGDTFDQTTRTLRKLAEWQPLTPGGGAP